MLEPMKRKQKHIDEARERGKKDLLLDILVVAGLIAIVFSVMQYINFRIDPIHAFLLGYKPVHIENDSMEPILPLNSLVFVRQVKYSALGAGDIFAYSTNGKDIVLRQVSSVNNAGIRAVAVKDGIYEGDFIQEEHVVGRLAFVWKRYALFTKKSTWIALLFLVISLTAAVASVLKRRKAQEKKVPETVCGEEEQDFLDVTPRTSGAIAYKEQVTQDTAEVYDFDTLLFEPQEPQAQPEYDFDTLLAGTLEAADELLLSEPEKEQCEAGDKREPRIDAQDYYQGIIDLL